MICRRWSPKLYANLGAIRALPNDLACAPSPRDRTTVYRSARGTQQRPGLRTRNNPNRHPLPGPRTRPGQEVTNCRIRRGRPGSTNQRTSPSNSRDLPQTGLRSRTCSSDERVDQNPTTGRLRYPRSVRRLAGSALKHHVPLALRRLRTANPGEIRCSQLHKLTYYNALATRQQRPRTMAVYWNTATHGSRETTNGCSHDTVSPPEHSLSVRLPPSPTMRGVRDGASTTIVRSAEPFGSTAANGFEAARPYLAPVFENSAPPHPNSRMRASPGQNRSTSGGRTRTRRAADTLRRNATSSSRSPFVQPFRSCTTNDCNDLLRANPRQATLALRGATGKITDTHLGLALDASRLQQSGSGTFNDNIESTAVFPTRLLKSALPEPASFRVSSADLEEEHLHRT